MLWSNTAQCSPQHPIKPKKPKEIDMANDLIEQIAQQWDGCMYESVGGDIDIGQAIRDAGKDLASTTGEAEPDDESEASLIHAEWVRAGSPKDATAFSQGFRIGRATPPAATPAAPGEVTDEQIGAAFYVWCPYDGKQRNDRELFAAGYRAALSNPAPVAAPAPASEAVAEVVSKFGDPEAFGEREIKVLSDLQKLPYGTKLYATPTPGDSADAPVQQAGEVANEALIAWGERHRIGADPRRLWWAYEDAISLAALKGEQPVEPSGTERGNAA
jgi:hypothetical protein